MLAFCSPAAGSLDLFYELCITRQYFLMMIRRNRLPAEMFPTACLLGVPARCLPAEAGRTDHRPRAL